MKNENISNTLFNVFKHESFKYNDNHPDSDDFTGTWSVRPTIITNTDITENDLTKAFKRYVGGICTSHPRFTLTAEQVDVNEVINYMKYGTIRPYDLSDDHIAKIKQLLCEDELNEFNNILTQYNITKKPTR